MWGKAWKLIMWNGMSGCEIDIVDVAHSWKNCKVGLETSAQLWGGFLNPRNLATGLCLTTHLNQPSKVVEQLVA